MASMYLHILYTHQHLPKCSTGCCMPTQIRKSGLTRISLWDKWENHQPIIFFSSFFYFICEQNNSSLLWLTKKTENISKAIATQNLETVTLNSAAPRERKFKWHCGCTVNVSGKTNKQCPGLDPGYVMTIISYKNSQVIWLDWIYIQWKNTVF